MPASTFLERPRAAAGQARALSGPPARPRLEWGAASTVAHDQARNGDVARVIPEHGLVVLSDGIGGHNAGEVASRLAVESIVEAVSAAAGIGRATDTDSRRRVLAQAVRNANAAILTAVARQPECLGMAATLCCVWLRDGVALLAHLGHSRVLRLRAGHLEALTQDHLMQTSFRHPPPGEEGGEAGQDSARVALPTRALGIAPIVEADLSSLTVEAGDRFLMGSRGLFERLDAPVLTGILSAQTDPGACARAVVSAAAHELADVDLSAIVFEAPSAGAGR